MDDAQVAAMAAQWRAHTIKQLDEMKLRQWCVEQAIKAYEFGTPGEENLSDIYSGILKFIIAPFADITAAEASEHRPAQRSEP
jgi:hypothetical protein